MPFTSPFSGRRALAATSALAFAIAVAFSASVAEAQIKGGVLAGASSTTFTNATLGDVCDPEVGCISQSTARRLGFQVGAFLTVPLRGALSFQPELHFIQKGATTSITVDVDEQVPLAADLEVRLAYVEVPLLLRLDLGSGARFRPFLVAGPSLGLRVGCELSVAVDGLGAFGSGCDGQGGFGAPEEGTVMEDPIKKFDAGGIIGGGITGLLQGRNVSAQVRYSRGFTSLLRESGGVTTMNTGLSILFGVGF
ncbi:MAG TPA: porin family protein [Gemmatimonas sp.]|nr:porin family protein [Gemmatimonas sp.]